MKKILLIASLLYISYYAQGQLSKNEEQQLVVGTVDSLFSNVLNEPREIWVHVPEDVDKNKKYPVIYLLDGPKMFHASTGITSLLEQWNMPKSIVVGISNTDRIRDFTPSKVAFHRGHKSETSGGALAFLTFMKEELAPYVSANYPADNMSTIIGHSTGGLFVVYAYLNAPNSFDNYLAIEPSLWWDKEKLVNQAKSLMQKPIYKNKSLYVAVGNSIDVDTVKVRKLKSEQSEMLRANLNFHDVLVENSSQLVFTWEYFGKEDHGSIVVPAFYNGLRALFSWYPFPEKWRFNNPKKYTSKELTNPFYEHYSMLSKRFKREVKPDWQFINDVGFFMLSGHNSPKKALAYLEMNVKFYPEKSESYVALGEYYVMRKNKEEAIHYFQKAVEIDNNEKARQKLAKLLKSR